MALTGSRIRVSPLLPPVQLILLVQLTQDLLGILRIVENVQDPLPQVLALGVGVVRRVQEVVDASLTGTEQRRLPAAVAQLRIQRSLIYKGRFSFSFQIF